MDLTNQRRMAASILKCGLGRVRMDPTKMEDISEAVTRQDVRKLIASGLIKARKRGGTSRVRALYRAAQRRKGRSRGPGHRKGGASARFPRKNRWMTRIRPVRMRLRELRDQGALQRSAYRLLYRQAKGGMFHDRTHLETQLRLRGLLKAEPTSTRRREKRRRLRREAARSVIPPGRLEKARKRREGRKRGADRPPAEPPAKEGAQERAESGREDGGA